MVANVGEQFAHRLKLPLLGLQFNFLISGEITYRIGLRFHLARLRLAAFYAIGSVSLQYLFHTGFG